MKFDRQKALAVLKREEVLFSSRLNPVELLPHLTCMSEMSKQEITCEQRNYGEKRATPLLLRRICQQDKCLNEFIQALRELSQSDLADMLDPRHLIDTGQNQLVESPVVQTYQDYPVRTKEISQSINGDTPIRHLDCGVMKILKKLDYDDQWKNLAEYLNYTLDEVHQLQATQRSCTEKLFEEWTNGDKPIPATMDSLFRALCVIERQDIITDLENKIGYKYVKPIIETDSESFIDIHKTGSKSICVTEAEQMTEFREDIKSEPVSAAYVSDKQNTGIPSAASPDGLFIKSGIGMDFNTEPFSIENNELLLCNDRNRELSPKVDDKELPVLEDSFKNNERAKMINIDSKDSNINNNTNFPEKMIKEKVIETVKRNPLVFGASLVGAFSLGFFIFNKTT